MTKNDLSYDILFLRCTISFMRFKICHTDYVYCFWCSVGIYTERDPDYSQQTRSSRSCGGASLTSSSRKEEQEAQLLRSLDDLCVGQHTSSRRGRGQKSRGWSAGMHRLRTTVARLRPLTASQTAQSIMQPRLLVIERGKRTFQPVRHLSTSVTAEPFLNGTSSNYLEEMYCAWLEDPKSVHKVPLACKLSVVFRNSQ